MRVAIIGFSGAGKTTLANALAGLAGTHPIQELDELWLPLYESGPLVLDGIPGTLEELAQIDVQALGKDGIEHILYLKAHAEVRIERVARMVIAGANPAKARDLMLHPAELEKVRRYLESTQRLTVIDATRSRSQVLQDALAALGIKI